MSNFLNKYVAHLEIFSNIYRRFKKNIVYLFCYSAERASRLIIWIHGSRNFSFSVYTNNAIFDTRGTFFIATYRFVFSGPYIFSYHIFMHAPGTIFVQKLKNKILTDVIPTSKMLMLNILPFFNFSDSKQLYLIRVFVSGFVRIPKT